MSFNKLLSMGSYDFVTADKFGKSGWLFFWPHVIKFGSFWTRFGLLAKSRSGNPDAWFPTNGICVKNNTIYMWREQAIID